MYSRYPDKNTISLSTIKTKIIQVVSDARHSFLSWSQLPLQSRIAHLSKVLSALESHKEQIITQMVGEIGKPVSQARKEVEKSLGYFKYYLEQAGAEKGYLADEVSYEDSTQLDVVKYQAKGVAAVILPWNYPFMLFIWMVIPNLIVGNTVVMKHSENSPGVAKLLTDLLNSTDLPEGVFQSVAGGSAEGKALSEQNIDLISFTGSTAVGRELYKTAAGKLISVVLELGGSNPALVFPGVSVEKAVANIIEKRFSNTGQYCNAVKRVLVHKSIFPEFLEKLETEVENLKTGDPYAPETQIGPLISLGQLELLERQIRESVRMGAEVVCGGEQLADVVSSGAATGTDAPAGNSSNTRTFTNYFAPTILTHVTPGMPVWDEETFGPVLPVVPFETEEEAIQLANSTDYGLGAVVLSPDPELATRVADRLHCGMVDINDGKSSKQCNPFGGIGCSGVGREHGVWGFRELTNVKVVSWSK